MKPLAVLALVSACGTSDADLSCAVLADPTNCWADTAAAMAACMPARATPAQMAADRKKCTFTDGAFVSFDDALPTTNTGFQKLSFTAYTPAGDFCGRFADTFTNHFELTANGSSEIAEIQPDQSFQLRCGDGQKLSADFSKVLACDGRPTDDYDVSMTMFTFTLSSIATPGPLFICQR